MKKQTSKIKRRRLDAYAFIDASNIIYGTRDEGWKVDFQKLFKYLKERYRCKKIYYFAGLDRKNRKQLKFYNRLKVFGYILILKPVKIYTQNNGKKVRKANCDVDLTFYAMRDKDKFERGVFLTGDGDFIILLKYLRNIGKQINIIANGKRTAKEIRQFLRGDFTPMNSLKAIISFTNKKG